jgi:hypothetical protein
MLTNSCASRTSGISYGQFVAAYKALAVANAQGFVIDAALDVTWSLYDITAESDVALSQARLLAAIECWFKDHGLPALYIWAIEEGATFGLHSHITMHLPAAHEGGFRNFLSSCLPERVIDPLPDGALSRGTPFMLQVNGGETTYHQWRRFQYTLKSIDPRVGLTGAEARSGEPTLAETCGIKPSFGGFMHIDRCSVAPALFSAGVRSPTGTIDSDNPPAFDDRFLHCYLSSRSR